LLLTIDEPEAEFTAEELENSFPLDTGRRFKDEAGRRLLAIVLEGMRSREARQRARSATAEAAWLASVEALLANLVAGALNVFDAHRYVGVSFNRNDYVRTGINRDVLAACRDHLDAEGLLTYAPGFHRWDHDRVGTFGRRSRVRATDKLRGLIDELGIGRRSLTIPASHLIRIKLGADDLPPPPDHVEDSRALLAKINLRLSAADIQVDELLKAAASARNLEDEGEDQDARQRKRRYAGDLTATSLYRAFKHDWSQGGRIYGGWWMSVKRDLRPFIRINGSQLSSLIIRPCIRCCCIQGLASPCPTILTISRIAQRSGCAIWGSAPSIGC
jgi:hypothetical protein